MTRRVVVIGGGIGGATAALSLARRGHDVVLLERSPCLGGLVVSFEVGGTPLECYYHHVFPHEARIRSLIEELGLGNKLGWHKSTVAVLRDGRIWPFTSPMDLLRFRPLPLIDRVRSGVGALRLAKVSSWEDLDGVPADKWLAQYTGRRAVDVVWEPLLRAKFGPAAPAVPASWMWARFQQRRAARQRGGERLGYLRGGFRQLFDALAAKLVESGVDLRLGATALSIAIHDGRAAGVVSSDDAIEADAVVFAGALPALSPLLPAGLRDQRWSSIDGLGVLCVVLELGRPLTSAYWTNVCDSEVPFGGIIEHTNLVPVDDYDGRHVVYLGRYFTAEEAVATADVTAETERWLDALDAALPSFSSSDVVAMHPFRTPYAAPLVTLGYRERIPPLQSHIPGLFVSTTAQIYPQDRGMDEGVRMGGEIADLVNEQAALVGDTA